MNLPTKYMTGTLNMGKHKASTYLIYKWREAMMKLLCYIFFWLIVSNVAYSDERTARINIDECAMSGKLNGSVVFECILTNTTERPLGLMIDISSISFQFSFFDYAPDNSVDGYGMGKYKGMVGFGLVGYLPAASLKNILKKHPPLIIPSKASCLYKKIIPAKVGNWQSGLAEMSVSIQLLHSLPTNYIGDVEIYINNIETQNIMSVEVMGELISVNPLRKTRHKGHNLTLDKQKEECGKGMEE